MIYIVNDNPCDSDRLLSALATADDSTRFHFVRIADIDLVADISGALYWEAERLLVVSDLHLEKGSSFATRGLLLPPFDTAATLARLGAVIARYNPRRIVALGDSFHDSDAHERVTHGDRGVIAALQTGRDWIWIAGNHDPRPPEGLGGATAQEIAIGDICLRHEPTGAWGEIAGHLHPAARVVSVSGSVRRRCFISDGARCILPAFGAYAGGLNIRDAAFAPLFGAAPVVAHVLGNARIYAVSHRNCVGD